jgi:hypothetical protein
VAKVAAFPVMLALALSAPRTIFHMPEGVKGYFGSATMLAESGAPSIHRSTRPVASEKTKIS